MPISKYFGGHGEQVMRDMKAKHGAKGGERVFYKTANARKQKPKKGSILRGKHLWLAFLLVAGTAEAQIFIPGTPTTGEETLSVSTTALGITADLCGTNNTKGALIGVLDDGVYMSLHSSTATPDSGDFALNAGDYAFVRPASKARFIRQSADSNVKIQCIE